MHSAVQCLHTTCSGMAPCAPTARRRAAGGWGWGSPKEAAQATAVLAGWVAGGRVGGWMDE